MSFTPKAVPSQFGPQVTAGTINPNTENALDRITQAGLADFDAKTNDAIASIGGVLDNYFANAREDAALKINQTTEAIASKANGAANAISNVGDKMKKPSDTPSQEQQVALSKMPPQPSMGLEGLGEMASPITPNALNQGIGARTV